MSELRLNTNLNKVSNIGKNINKQNKFAQNPVAFSSKQDSFEFNNPTSKGFRNELQNIKTNQGLIGKAWDGFKNLTHIGASSNKIEKTIKDFEQGKVSKEEVEQKIEQYKEGQSTALDVASDMISGIVSMGAFALCVPTGGASLALGLGLSTLMGASVKTGIKLADAKVSNNEYSKKDLTYDFLTGAVNGLFAPVTNGIGANVTKTIGKKLGLTVIKDSAVETGKQIAKKGAVQAIKSTITTKAVDVTGGTIAKRALALGAGMAVDGAISGAADNMTRAALDDKDILKAGAQGAFGGLVMSPIIGGGFRMASSVGHSLNNKITTKKVLPQGTNTKFQQGKTGDCALLSTLDGLMDNKKTEKLIKKSITQSYGEGIYQVKIGNSVMNISKHELTDEMLSDTTGIKILEAAYKKYHGSIDGGFADVVAKEFGLKPIHIETISDEILDKIQKEGDNLILSLGAKIDAGGNISSRGTNHYFRIKNIDSTNKSITLVNPYNTSKSFDISYNEAKKLGISIDGGAINKTEIINAPRNPKDALFYCPKSDKKEVKFLKTIFEDENSNSAISFKKALEEIELDGKKCSVADFASMAEYLNLSQKELKDCFDYILDEISFEDYVEIDMADTVVLKLNRALNNHMFIKNNSLFAPFALSLDETYKLYDNIFDIKFNLEAVKEILKNNNPQVFESLGGEKYIYNNVENLRRIVLDMPVYEKFIDVDKMFDAGISINGEKKYLNISKDSELPSFKGEIDIPTLIKTNMVTEDILEGAMNAGFKFPSAIKAKAKNAMGETVVVTFNTNEILQKVKNQGFNSLSSLEIHGLTDCLSDLYVSSNELQKIVRKQIGENGNVKFEKIYACADLLRKKANPILAGTSVEFSEHAFLRMIDRNLTSSVDLSNGRVLSYEELIDKLANAVQKAGKTGHKEAQLKGVEGSEGIRMLIQNKNGKFVVNTIMS